MEIDQKARSHCAARARSADPERDSPRRVGRCRRHQFFLVGLAVLFALLVAVPVSDALAEFDIDKVKNSVVRIIVQRKRDGKTVFASGSGFVIDDQGHVATNHHVISDAVWIKVPDGSWAKMLPAEVVWSGEHVDLAIIKVGSLKRPAVALAVPEPKRGSRVWAVGYPGPGDSMERRAGGRLSLVATVTSGVVGKIFTGGHKKDERTFRRMIQHSAEVNAGNSGGPLFNSCHQVIGIHTYSRRTVLKVVKDRRSGKQIAQGRTPQGIFNGSHVSVLIEALRRRQITFTPATGPCLLGPIAKTSVPIEIYIYIGVASVLAAFALLFALRRPRERMVRVVETYSEMIRRKRREMAPNASPPPEPRAPRPDPEAATATPGWHFSGFDREGRIVEFVVSDAALERSTEGLVIGRKAAIVDHVIEDKSVSRRHARVVPLEDGIGVVDLKTTLGTKVSGRRIEPRSDPVPIVSGSNIALGGVTLKVTRL